MDPNSSAPSSPGIPPISGPTGAPLDPKLQEAYNKVMSFSADPNAAPPIPAMQPTDPKTMPQPMGAAPTSPLSTPTDPLAQPQPLASVPDPLAQPQPMATPANPTMPTISDPTAMPQPMTTTPSTDPLAQPQSTPQPLGQPAPADPQPALNTSQTSMGGSMFSTTPESAPVTPTMTSPTPPAAPTATPGATVVINGTPTTHDGQAAHGMSAKKKGGSMMPLLLVFGAIIFIALYAIIWVKIFNIQVPFLPF